MKNALLIILSLLSAALYLFINNIDPAIQPLNGITSPVVLSREFIQKPHIVLISYAGGQNVFVKNQNALNASAINKGFDTIISYNKTHIDQDFYLKNKDILQEKIGGGYWLWKPYFVMKTMEQYPDDTIIVYADSGIIFQKEISKILNLLQDREIAVIGERRLVPYRNYLKMEARKLLNIPQDSNELNDPNLIASFIALKNSPNSRRIIKDWLTICQIPGAITNLPFDPSIQEKNFDYHQHDQALLNVVLSRNKQYITVIPRDGLRKNYGIVNYHRHKEQEYKSSIGVMAGWTKIVNDIIFNPFPIKKAREWHGESELSN